MALRSVVVIAAAIVGLARAGGLGDIEHVILLMQGQFQDTLNVSPDVLRTFD